MQQSDLDLIIKHLEQEVDYLKSSMEACVINCDFDGAKAFLVPYRIAQQQLNVYKSLEDCDYLEKLRLNSILNIDTAKILDKSIPSFIRKSEEFEKFRKIQLELKSEWKDKQRKRLVELQSKEKALGLDQDIVLEYLEQLQLGEIQYMKLEQDADRDLALMCTIEEEVLSLKIVANGDADVEGYLVPSARKAMKDLGFSSEDYILNISDYRSIPTYQILQTISIIFFDVFRAYEGNLGRMIVG